MSSERPLSVLIVSPAPEVFGGVSTFIETLKRHLRNCQVEDFRVGSSVHGSKENIFSILKRLCSAPFQIAAMAKRRKFDVIHLNPSLVPKSAIRDGMILLALRLAGVRNVLVYFHGWRWGMKELIMRSKMLRLFTAWLLNGASRIAVLGEDFKKGLIDIGVNPEQIITVTTMYDADGLESVFNEPSTNKKPFILFMSRFEREKGLYELLHAFAKLAPEFPDIELILAGDGDERASLRTHAAQLGCAARIRFPGYVTGIDKWLLLRDCTLFALPTYAKGEGMPVALLEAMGAGKPILTGVAGSIRSIVSDPENGIIIENITAESVEAGLRWLLQNPDYCTEISQHNCDYARQRFAPDAVAANIEILYQKISRSV